MSVIVLTAMQGRHETVKYCFDKMPNLFKVVMYSTEEDYRFLNQFKNVKAYKVPNDPLSNKWNSGIKMLEKYDFDKVILLGSDDYVDKDFVEFVDSDKDHDMIGFVDLYFENKGKRYYWGGYVGHRRGEPAGAGKTYTKDFLKKLNFDLFPPSKNRSLDGLSWIKVKKAKANVLIASLKKNGLMCCDVKDGKGMTKFEKIPNMKKA